MITAATGSGLRAAFFASLAGAGYGLLAWSGLTIALLALRGGLSPALEGVQLAGLAVGMLLAGIGIARAVAGLGGAAGASRALARLRTSWQSRELALALATVLLAAASIALLLWMPGGATRAALLACLGLPLAALALATMACTAMAWASLGPVPAWRHPLVLPGHLLLALLTGLALQLVTLAAMLPGQGPAGMLPTLVLFGLMLAVLKWLYWRGVDAAPAVAAGSLEAPPRQTATPRHMRQLRLAVVAGLLAAPLLATGLMILGWLPALAATVLAALGLQAGAFAERWLFLAPARRAASTGSPEQTAAIVLDQ